MKNLLSFLAATFVACLGFCGFATDDHWTYSSGQISDGDWVFTATVSGNNLTVKTPVDDTDPSQCPTTITALDFSKPVVDSADSSKRYTIVNIDTKFWPYNGTKRASADFVGELTLPGEGLTTISGEAFRQCSNLFGDIVIPDSVTALYRFCFEKTKITSAIIGAGANAQVNSEIFGGCSSMTSIVFKAGGSYTMLDNSRPLTGCGSLKNADLSGVVAIAAHDKNHILFSSCGNLTNLTVNSSLVLTKELKDQALSNYWNVVLSTSNSKLVTIRFTGAAPDELDKWIATDGGFLSVVLDSQDVTTIVPAAYRNTKNASGKCWADYSASGKLNTIDSTWAATNVASGVSDLSKRKLLLDSIPEDDPPFITSPAVSNVGSYSATVTANGYGLGGGTIFVSLTNSVGALSGPMEISSFGDSCTFSSLSASTLYSVIVVATNNYGATTNATCSFTTQDPPPRVSVVKGSDAYEKTCAAGSFVISREVAKAETLVVHYAMSGTATNGESYVTLSGSATIPANETSVTVPVTPLYNPYMKEDATATITLTADAAYEIAEPSAASLTLFDGGLLGVSVAKGGDADFNKSQNGSFVISRGADDATVYPVVATFTVGGTSTAGKDYTSIPTTATIPVGQSSTTISIVPLYSDTANNTTVVLSITDAPTYVVGTGTATVNVKQVEVKHYSIAAGTNPTGTTRGTFIVSRGADDPIDQKVTLTYTVSGDGVNAIYALSGTVVIPPYATSATIDVFAKNADGSDVPLTVTLDTGYYSLVTASATITITAGAASEYWSVDTSNNRMSWGGWTFGVKNIAPSKTPATLECDQYVPGYPSSLSPLDFSLPVVDGNGTQYVLTGVSMRYADVAAKNVVGELTLPGEGLTGFGYAAFNACVNMTGTLAFPTTCIEVGGEAFNKCANLKILGRSFASVTKFEGKDSLVSVAFVGEVKALSLKTIPDGGFYGSKVESVRFGPGLTSLYHGDDRNGCFESCTSLTNVVFDPASRVTLGNGRTFKGCTSLTSIDLSVVTNITCGTQPSTFYGCSALTNVIFGAELHNLASNVFEEAFKSLSANYSVTFKGLPPENLELPYLSKLASTRVSSKDPYTYPAVTTYVHRDMVSTKNSAGKCWNDYAAGGKINSSGTTWASDYLPSDVPVAVRPLQTIEQGEKKKGFMLLVR